MIRGPIYDFSWIFSGVPIGLALALWPVPISVLFAAFLALNSAHLVAPVVMAWSHDGFRQVMLRRKTKFIAVPLTIIALGAAAGLTVGKTFPINPVTLGVQVRDWSDYARPLIALLPVYFAWNAFHYGMQNYGFLRLYRPAGDRALAMQIAMFATLFGLVIIPTIIHQQQVFLFLFGAVIVNHQLAAIGLSAHVWGNHHQRSPWGFALALIAFGAGVAWLMLHAPQTVIMLIVGLRVTAGFVHFLYERWDYKFSDQRVRETIGRDLTAHPQVIEPFPALPMKG